MTDQILFSEHVISLHQDAVMWKAGRLWATAIDPDSQAVAIEELVQMLLSISNEVKRAGYVDALQKDLKIKGGLLKKAIKDEAAKAEARKQAAIVKQKLQSAYANAEEAGLPNNFRGDVYDALKYGIYEYEGIYRSRGARGDYDISNFTMKILYHIQTGDEHAFRMIALRNVYGFDKMIMMNTDDLVSLGAFKKVIARYGDFIFKGADSDLARLLEFLQRDEKRTVYVKTLGWNRRGQFYGFANGIVTSGPAGFEFVPVDNHGIVPFNNKNYVIPALSEMYAEKDDLYTNEKKFIYNKPIDGFAWKEWSCLFADAYGDKAIAAILFYMGSLFRDVIMKLIQRFPLLNLFGPPGAGKGQLAESILCMFGEPQDQIMLGGASTVVGFMRKFAQFSNALVWLDEYKNNLPIKFIESLKNLYDGKGYERGKMTNDFTTESTPIYSSCLLSGQHMPTAEPALFMRCIMLSFQEGKFTDDQRRSFAELKEREKNGLSYITASVLGYRNIIEENFKERQAIIFKQTIKDVAEVDIDDRMVLNISILLAIYHLLKDVLPFPFTYAQAKDWLIKNMRNQHTILAGNNEVSRFWQTVEAMFHQGALQDGRDFQMEDGFLYLRLQQVQPQYQKEMIQQRDMNFLTKATLEHYFSLDKTVWIDHKKKRFRDGSNTWSHQFKYDALVERYQVDFTKLLSDLNLNSGWKPMQEEAPL